MNRQVFGGFGDHKKEKKWESVLVVVRALLFENFYTVKCAKKVVERKKHVEE